jgi:hypothetical protein
VIIVVARYEISAVLDVDQIDLLVGVNVGWKYPFEGDFRR